MQIKKIMNKDIPTIHQDEPILKAIKLLVKIPQSALPVTDDDGNIVGELDQKQLLLLDIGKFEFKDDELNFDQIKDLLASDAKTVKDLMDHHEITLTPDDDVLDAAKLMYDEDISTIPIIENKKLVGIITEICILKHYKELAK